MAGPGHDLASIAHRFYAQLVVGAPAADALHAVVREVRADRPEMPSVWAAHGHTGL